jgi:hypothetical protein
MGNGKTVVAGMVMFCGPQFWLFAAIPKYLNFATFSDILLAVLEYSCVNVNRQNDARFSKIEFNLLAPEFYI